jgi:hypothetical protein
MFRKQFLFLAAALLFGKGLGLADSRLPLLPENLGPSPAHRLWAWNLEAEPADVIVESSTAAKVRVEPGKAVEVSELPQTRGPAERSEDAAVLLVAAPRDFDPSALVIDGEARVRLQKAGRRMRTTVLRPAWAASLLAMTAGKGQLSQGESAEVPAEADSDGRVRLAAALEKGSAVKVVVRDEQGEALRSFSLTSGAPVRLQIDLGSAEELRGARLALQVHRGRAVAGISRGAGGGLSPIQAKSVVCSSSVSPSNVIYSGSYSYSVSGCPANTCGELNIKRNGNWEFTGTWICTDSSGNATKGPWNWSDKASDETGDPIFIRWPGAGSPTTDETFIIVDKDCSRTYRDSADGAPPSSFYGHATDNTWGAGFDFGGFCICYFRDLTAQTLTVPSATMTRIDRWNVNWSCTPPSTVSGHQYEWSASCLDGYCGYDTPILSFTKP